MAHSRGIALQLINIFEVKVQFKLLEELYLYLLLLTSTTGLLLSLPQSSSIPFLLLLFFASTELTDTKFHPYNSASTSC